jgi:phage I-like protein
MTAKAPFKALEIGPDGWAHGILIGELKIDRPKPAKEGSDEGSDEITQIVTAADCAAIVAAFDAGGQPLLVDRDHSSDLGDSTEAYGWVKAMRLCPDGAEVLLELTDIGRTAVEGKRWRYLSPVFPWEDFVYDDAARLRGHPRRCSRFAFTNRPRMRGIRPVVNAEGGPTPKPTPKPNPKGTSMDYKAKLLSMLGLADTATDEEIQTAIDAASGAKADGEADAALNAAGIPDTPAIRDPVKQAYRASSETGLNALNAVKATFALGAAKPTPPARVPFRALNAEARTAPPALNGAAFESAREQAIEAAAKTFNLKSRADAVARAQRERPDLWQ